MRLFNFLTGNFPKTWLNIIKKIAHNCRALFSIVNNFTVYENMKSVIFGIPRVKSIQC